MFQVASRTFTKQISPLCSPRSAAGTLLPFQTNAPSCAEPRQCLTSGNIDNSASERDDRDSSKRRTTARRRLADAIEAKIALEVEAAALERRLRTAVWEMGEAWALVEAADEWTNERG